MKKYDIMKRLPTNSYFCFQASIYIWQCHLGEQGDHLSANRILHCRYVDSSWHSSQGVPGILLLLWTISLYQATSSRWTGWTSSIKLAPLLHSVDLSKQWFHNCCFQPGAFVRVIWTNRVNYLAIKANPGKVFSRFTRVVYFNFFLLPGGSVVRGWIPPFPPM